MKSNELEMWWASLSITQKERIALKALKKKSPGTAVDSSEAAYPACTVVWCALSEPEKIKIHDHCESRHGYVLNEWNDADPYGD